MLMPLVQQTISDKLIFTISELIIPLVDIDYHRQSYNKITVILYELELWSKY